MSAEHGRGSPECREIFARLSEFLDDELDPGACAELEGHMDDCPPCRAFLESLRRTVELTREVPFEELPEELTGELLRTYKKMREPRDS